MSMFTLGASRPALRTALTTLFLIVPAIAFAADNGNLGTPQNDCEQRATNDYQTNLASCDSHLAGDSAAIAQCKQDFSYDYEDALRACKTAAFSGGSRVHVNLNGLKLQQTQTVSSGKSFSRTLKFGGN